MSQGKHRASLGDWIKALEGGGFDRQLAALYGNEAVAPWRANYLAALAQFQRHFGGEGQVVIARCPGQMNLMGMHIDYGGMPSLRLAVRGADTLVVARPNADGRVRLRNQLAVKGEAANRFEPVEFDLAKVCPAENVGDRQALMDYAGKVCSQREAGGGDAVVNQWDILPEGVMVYLESYFRGRQPFKGFDGMVWSNVSPSGGMSSSSALIIATACAALGANGLVPRADLPEAELVDGAGTSEWIRGTRGGTADHGGMVMGRSGQLVSVGVFPAQALGYAQVPGEYGVIILDSGVPRVYDEAGKEETVIAYPLGTFLVRDVLLPQLAATPAFAHLRSDWTEQISFIRDITSEKLGFDGTGIYALLAAIPKQTSLSQLEDIARQAGAGRAWEQMYQRDVAGKFERIGPDYPIMLRRRFAFGLAEQDRVGAMLEFMNADRMDMAFELVRISHDGDLDVEVEDSYLAQMEKRLAAGDERGRLCFVGGGYGRMTPAYDRAVRQINEFLLAEGGAKAGTVQRLGAGWGGNVGGLLHRDFFSGERRSKFEALLQRLEIRPDLEPVLPGEGAGLLDPPEGA